MASATASDGFVYPKGLYYQIKVNGGRPRLLKQGVIDPGPGVAVQMPSMVEDQQGNLGITWMEQCANYQMNHCAQIHSVLSKMRATVIRGLAEKKRFSDTHEQPHT
jgi:hypothetical protein